MNQTYIKILQITDRFIQTKGFHGFSYGDLSKELGITKASIHHYFPVKTDLGVAYCQHKIEEMGQLRDKIISDKPGLAQLSVYLNAFSQCSREKSMCGINAMQSDSELMDLVLQEKLEELTRIELNILTELLELGKANGLFNFYLSSWDQALLICTAVKGSLLLNRLHINDAYQKTCEAIIKQITN